jgi:hypothetical protein
LCIAGAVATGILEASADEASLHCDQISAIGPVPKNFPAVPPNFL